MVEDFFGELDIAFCAARARVIGQDRLSEAGGFGQADAAGDDTGKNLVCEELFEVGCDLAGEVGAVIEHGQENAFDVEGMAKGIANAVDCIHELGNPFKGKELALDRHEDRIGGDEGVQSEEIEGWGAVDENVLVVTANLLKTLAEAELAVGKVDQLKIGGDEVLIRRDEMKAIKVSGNDGAGGWGVSKEDVIEAGAVGIFGDTEAGSRVALGVGIDDEDSKVAGCQGGCQVDGSGGFADPAFLVSNCKNAAQAAILTRFQCST
jgi:hypothetical protein